MSRVSLAQPDITLHLDEHGMIREAAWSDAIAEEGIERWVGRSWLDTVGGAGADTIRLMMSDARASGVSAFRQVVQRFPSGRELPIEYTTVQVTGTKGELMVLGKNLQAVAELQSRLIAAQQASEREYWKLRDIETRYRLLLDASSEAVLTIGGDDLRIVEANPAAVRGLGLVAGSAFTGGLPENERQSFVAMLERVRDLGRAPGLVLHFGPGREPWAVRASLTGSEPGLRYLLHVAPAGTRAAAPANAPVPLETLIERLPDAIVIVGGDGAILRANQAFLDLVQVGAAGTVQGQSLGRWLTQPGADAGVLLATVRRHGSVRMLQTVLHGELGAETTVEASAAGIGDPGASRAAPGAESFAIVLRDVGRRPVPPAEAVSADDSHAVLASVTRQLGQAPLLQVVRMAADAIERSMIGAALQRVDGNRTAAAELLGLSRQSLHTKLNRHAAETGPIGEPEASAG